MQSQTHLAAHLELKSIISERKINCHFQGIYDLENNEIVGYEALARCPSSINLKTPALLFGAAEQSGQFEQLEQLCIETAIESFVQLNLTGRLFINVSPNTFVRLLDERSAFAHAIYPNAKNVRLVLEISEKDPYDDYEKLRKTAFKLRQHSIAIAIDDLGAGYSGLRTWSELRPDFVKIDGHFLSGVDHDSVKREFVRSIVEIARGLNCDVIAEGIETTTELETLNSMGRFLGQGYLLHKPCAAPNGENIRSKVINTRSVSLRTLNTRHSESAASVMTQTRTISPSTNAEDVNDYFKANLDIDCIPVIDNEIPVGLVTRRRILEAFSGRFSHELFGKRPISKFMLREFVCVDKQERLEDVSEKVTRSECDAKYHFVILSEGRYAGIGRVDDLLRVITDYQIRLARHCNPLTLLPGSVKISEHIDTLLDNGQSFHFAYLDLNNFKPYNDYYGYHCGDNLLKSMGELVSNNMHPSLDMVGHLGGDDFVIIMRSEDWKLRCEHIMAQFEERLPAFYDDEDLARGGIMSKNRANQDEFFPLTGIAIGVIKADSEIDSHHELSARATQAKRLAKKKPHSYLYILNNDVKNNITSSKKKAGVST